MGNIDTIVMEYQGVLTNLSKINIDNWILFGNNLDDSNESVNLSDLDSNDSASMKSEFKNQNDIVKYMTYTTTSWGDFSKESNN